jgi:hypothetical protein
MGVKWLGRDADHSPLSSAEVKEWVELYLHYPVRLHGWCSVNAQGHLYLYWPYMSHLSPVHNVILVPNGTFQYYLPIFVLISLLTYLKNFSSQSDERNPFFPMPTACKVRLFSPVIARWRVQTTIQVEAFRVVTPCNVVVGGPCCLHHPEDGGSKVLWNIGILPQHYVAP